MHKIGCIFSWILTLIGISFLFITLVTYSSLSSFIPAINETLLPGKTYILDYTVPSIISIACIIVGIIMCYYFYRKESHTK